MLFDNNATAAQNYQPHHNVFMRLHNLILIRYPLEAADVDCVDSATYALQSGAWRDD